MSPTDVTVERVFRQAEFTNGCIPNNGLRTLAIPFTSRKPVCKEQCKAFTSVHLGAILFDVMVQSSSEREQTTLGGIPNAQLKRDNPRLSRRQAYLQGAQQPVFARIYLAVIQWHGPIILSSRKTKRNHPWLIHSERLVVLASKTIIHVSEAGLQRAQTLLTDRKRQ